MPSRRTYLFVVIIVFAFNPALYATDCAALSKDTPERITKYLAQRLVSGEKLAPSIVAIATLPDSCYRKLTISIPSVSHQIVMYLSPDERFITSTLYDLSDDPKREVARIAAEVEKLLLQDEPLTGDSYRTIRIVEFGDFECPYCKQFAEWYQTLPNELKSQTTLIFKHLPLPQHPWARMASVYAGCVKLQSAADFSHLSSFFLNNQNQLTPENIVAKTIAELADDKSLDLGQLKACTSNGNGDRILQRDEEIARQLNVTGTPTVFINGKRILPIHSLRELEQVLEQEFQQRSNSENPQINQEAQRGLDYAK